MRSGGPGGDGPIDGGGAQYGPGADEDVREGVAEAADAAAAATWVESLGSLRP